MPTETHELGGTARSPRLHEAVVFLVAVVGRLPALGAWWCRDDWGQLARAAGIIAPEPGFPARWLSQHLYWSLAWPLFGLDATPHAVVRLALHGLAAALVVRLGRRAGLGTAGSLGAGLLLAASPLAFTPLYWASGIRELLAATLALLAVERWLAGMQRGRGALLVAAGAGILSMLAKEPGLGLPILLLAFLWLGIGVRLQDKAFAWALVMLLLLFTVTEGALVIHRFATGPGALYNLGGLREVAGNLGGFGWWLLSPGPILSDGMAWPMTAAGAAMFVLWLLWGITRWRSGHRVPLLALVGTMLALAPALPLQHVAPHLAYLAAAGWCLALGSLLPRRLPVPAWLLVSVALVAASWGFFGMKARLAQRTELGLPADAIVAATSVSWEAGRTLRGLVDLDRTLAFDQVTLLQFPVGAAAREQAARFGAAWVAGGALHTALGGDLGPSLILRQRPGTRVRWANSLLDTPAESVVFAETTTGLRYWGPTRQAVLYAALTDVGLENFERARQHLGHAAALHDERVVFVYDEGQMVVPLQAVVHQKEAFIDWTLSLLPDEASPAEVGGMQEMFFHLFSSATGRSLEDVTAGSRLLSGRDGPPEPGPKE